MARARYTATTFVIQRGAVSSCQKNKPEYRHVYQLKINRNLCFHKRCICFRMMVCEFYTGKKING